VRVRIATGAETLALDTRDGWTAGGRAIPCHRCGVCCERWQPLLTRADAARLAAHLRLAPDTFRDTYTVPYPFDDERRLLRQEAGRCVFLRYEERSGVRRASCAIHPARPDVCREWAAGLDKKECVQGLERFADAAGLIQITDLYPEPENRAAFVCGPGRAGPG
jgi:Fe-S-cluster containining protein